MSKAFVTDDAKVMERPSFRRELVAVGENYITPQGYQALESELKELESELGSMGSELSPVEETRRTEIETRTTVLKRTLESARIIDPETQSGSRVIFGATVTVRDEDDRERVYRLVGIDEADAKQNKVSWISPIGRALLQTKVGDVINFTCPTRSEELEIIKIEFKAIE